MAESSERNREMVQIYLGAFLDYEKRVWPNSAVCSNATNAALMLVAAAREEGRREAIEAICQQQSRAPWYAGETRLNAIRALAKPTEKDLP